MDVLKKTLKIQAKKILTKFDAPFTLAVNFNGSVTALSVATIEDTQYFLTQKNDVPSVNFAFDFLKDKNNRAVIVLETGDDYKATVAACTDQFAEFFGGSVKAFLPADVNAKTELFKRGAIHLDGVGIATFGRSIDEAICALEILLKARLALRFGNPTALSGGEIKALHLGYKTRSAKNQKETFDLETIGKHLNVSQQVGLESIAEIIVYAKKAEIEELSQGTWRSVSIRHGDNFFITPENKSNAFLTESDIVKINLKNGFHKPFSKPSSDKNLHRAIYNARGDIGAIIHCHPIYSSVNAELGEKLIVSEKMRRILGEKISVTEYKKQRSKQQGEAAVCALKGRVAAFLFRQGLVVVGKTVQDAYWTLNAIEDECQKFYRNKEDLWQHRT